MEATCNHNMGQGRTLERAKDNRRLSSSARTTRNPSCNDRALREASDRGSKPIQKEKGRSTNDNRRSRRSGNRPTHLTHKVTISRRAVTTRRNSPKRKGKHTKPTLRSRTTKPRPRRGDPIAKGVNHMGEENPQEPAEPEQARADRQEGHETLGPTNCGRTTTGTARQHT